MSEYNLIPIRCSCRKLIGHLYEKYKEALRSDKNDPDAAARKFFTKHGIIRYCCMTRFLTHVEILPYASANSSKRVLDNVDYLKKR